MSQSTQLSHSIRWAKASSPSDNQIIPEEGDHERINFMEKARLGIEGARSRNDQAMLTMLQSAMRIMQSHQDQTIGVHTRA